MNIKGTCEKVESVEKGLKLTIYITDEAQMDEAFRLRKKEVSISLGNGGQAEDITNKEAVREMAAVALRQALAFLYAEPNLSEDLTAGVLQGEQLSLVGSD